MLLNKTKQPFRVADKILNESKIRFRSITIEKPLIDACDAASMCLKLNWITPKLDLLINCLENKLILTIRIKEEFDVVQ